jgi:prepilin-type N-terminal cleavage/methylation domain-containing protein
VENFMNAQTKNKMKGFTIIEVVLVLAIAGLIFLMVFIALPALQRSQRDQARKNDVTTVSSAVTSYTSNNRGDFPSTAELSSYVEEVSENTETVTVGDSSATEISPEDGVVVVTQETSCGTSGTDSQALEDGTVRQFTTVTKLESGNGAYFCLDS